MKKLVGNMPLLAFIVAAFAAVAFTSPENDDPLFGTPDGGITWVQVNDPQNPVNYLCNEGSEACLYEDESMDHPVDDITDRKFVLIP